MHSLFLISRATTNGPTNRPNELYCWCVVVHHGEREEEWQKKIVQLRRSTNHPVCTEYKKGVERIVPVSQPAVSCGHKTNDKNWVVATTAEKQLQLWQHEHERNCNNSVVVVFIIVLSHIVHRIQGRTRRNVICTVITVCFFLNCFMDEIFSVRYIVFSTVS